MLNKLFCLGAIPILQSVKACEGLPLHPFYFCKAVQGCAGLMNLVHHTMLLYIRVSLTVLL